MISRNPTANGQIPRRILIYRESLVSMDDISTHNAHSSIIEQSRSTEVDTEDIGADDEKFYDAQSSVRELSNKEEYFEDAISSNLNTKFHHNMEGRNQSEIRQISCRNSSTKRISVA